MNKFTAFVGLLTRWSVDHQNMLRGMRAVFDVDRAIGDQLDIVGEWVGVSRDLDVPLEGVHFALDTEGVGLDEGILKGPYDPEGVISRLPDDQYRILIYGQIAANHWDGTIEGAYSAWDTVFAPLGYTIMIQDGQDMTMSVGLVGKVPDAVTQSLFRRGLISQRPAGVHINFTFNQSVLGVPVFGLDADNDQVSGLDKGYLVNSL